jgi:hypothetical protein
MTDFRQAAYQIDPALWVRDVLGVIPTAWQETFLRAQRGASILALTARQVGKTTTAAWVIAHAMVFMAGSLSESPVRRSARARKRCDVSVKACSRWAPSWRATMSMRSNWTLARACWRCPAATTRFAG